MLKDQYIQYHFAWKNSFHPPRSGICGSKESFDSTSRHPFSKIIHIPKFIISFFLCFNILTNMKPIYKVIISWLLRFQITSPCHASPCCHGRWIAAPAFASRSPRVSTAPALGPVAPVAPVAGPAPRGPPRRSWHDPPRCPACEVLRNAAMRCNEMIECGIFFMEKQKVMMEFSCCIFNNYSKRIYLHLTWGSV